MTKCQRQNVAQRLELWGPSGRDRMWFRGLGCGDSVAETKCGSEIGDVGTQCQRQTYRSGECFLMQDPTKEC